MTVFIDKKLSERFEVAFNQIHRWLQKNLPHARSDKFTELLKEGFSSYSFIRKYYHDLRIYARLRNSIVHDKIKLDYYIAEPHESVVVRIEKIASQLIQPVGVLSIATKPVFYFYEDARLIDILNVINKHSYSIFPIYDLNGYKWVLTAESIIQWFSEHLVANTIDLSKVIVKDIYSLSKSSPVEFVNEKAGIFEIEELFEEYHLKNQKLEAVLITKNGQKMQKPIGIVTSWDLVEIDVLD